MMIRIAEAAICALLVYFAGGPLWAIVMTAILVLQFPYIQFQPVPTQEQSPVETVAARVQRERIRQKRHQFWFGNGWKSWVLCLGTFYGGLFALGFILRFLGVISR